MNDSLDLTSAHGGGQEGSRKVSLERAGANENRGMSEFKPIEIRRLEKMLVDVDSGVDKIFSRKKHRIIRAIAEMIFKIHVLEIQLQGSTKYKGKRLRKSLKMTTIIRGSFLKTEASMSEKMTEGSEFGKAVVKDEGEEDEAETWDKVIAQFLEITTFELALFMDVMRKNVGEIFKERQKYEIEIEKQAEYDKRNILFSRALKL